MKTYVFLFLIAAFSCKAELITIHVPENAGSIEVLASLELKRYLSYICPQDSFDIQSVRGDEKTIILGITDHVELSPHITGVMGVSLFPQSYPMLMSSFLK